MLPTTDIPRGGNRHMVSQHSNNLCATEIAPIAIAARVVTSTHRLRLSIALAAILALAATLLCYELTKPFTGHNDWNSALMSSAGRNHLRYGFAATRFGVIENNDVIPPKWFRYYTDHPPLVPLFVSLAFRFFGEHEWAARLVPIIFSLGSVLLVYFLGSALEGHRLGLLSALVYAFLPMTVYFGRMLCHEAPTNFFALATALAYLRWHRDRRTGFFAAALTALSLGMLCGWPGYYLAGLLPLHHIMSSGYARREWKILFFPLTAIVLFGLHLGHIFWLQGTEGLTYLGSMFLLRTHLYLSPSLEALGANLDNFTWAAFLVLETKRADALFTPLALILAALSLYDLVRHRRREAALSDPVFIVVLLLFGTSHVIVFSQGAWHHRYWLFYYSTVVAVLAAHGALSLAGLARDSRVLGVLGVLFVLAALPRIQALHNIDNPSIYPTALLLKELSRPGEQIVTNAPAIYEHAPEVGYYAGRDVSYNSISKIPQLEHRFAVNGQRSLAFVLLEEAPGGSELGPWLSSRYPSERVDFLGKQHLIFHMHHDCCLPVAR
jgi:4-amino-4-deoxy-L-arabinose transferase-like glycosyltransferase